MSFNIITNATSNITTNAHNASMTETKTKYRNDNSITKEIIPLMSSIYNNNDKESKDQFEDTNNTNTATTTRNRIRISISRRRRITSSALANNILSILFIFYIVATITNNDFKISMNMLVLVNADETNSTNSTNITTTSTNNTNSINSTDITNSTDINNSTDITNSTESTNQTATNETSTSATNNTNTTTISISSEGDMQVIKPNYWSGCVDPDTMKYEPIKKGQTMTVCIVVSKGGNWANQTIDGDRQFSRITFQPTVDEYSSFSVSYAFKDLIKDADVNGYVYKPFVSVHIASNQTLSFIRRYHDIRKIFPYLTAIINVDNGDIKGIEWDNACVFCNSSRCEENSYDFEGNQNTEIPNSKGCYIHVSECVEELKDAEKESSPSDGEIEKGGIDKELLSAGNCNLKIYFVWTGTDKDGRPLQSYESRYGAFPPAVVPQFAHTALDVSNNAMDWFNDKIESAKNMVNMTRMI